MLVDTVTITVKAGNGGNGAVSFRHTGQTAKGGPDGGNGGNGGSIYVQGSTNITDLREFRYKKKIVAKNGVPGGKNNLFGKNAEDITFFVPLGTTITNTENNKTKEITDVHSKLLVACGGKGGRGNYEFRTATNQAPKTAEKGEVGEVKQLLLDLKLIADVGIIGLPNAGKSSLLSVLTNARPKIGDYPFTTLEPMIGMFGTHPIADIPGLISGASLGKGLGIRFLKHIEKTRLFIHCIDLTQNDPLASYRTIRHEFELYNPELGTKPEVILLTKTDLVSRHVVEAVRNTFREMDKKILEYSVYDPQSIDTLKEQLQKILS